MPQDSRLASTLYILAVLSSLCVLAISSVAAKPAKDRSIVVPTPKQGPVRTDLTPRNKNDCLAVAQTLNEQAKKLSQQPNEAVPREFTRVASNLDRSCGEEDFKKAWISIEWMNGCLNNFTKDAELGFCSRNEGYSCALSPRSDACPKNDDGNGRAIGWVHATAPGRSATRNEASIPTDADGASVIAQETGTETGLRSLLRTLWLVRFRIRDHPAPSRCSARGLSSS